MFDYLQRDANSTSSDKRMAIEGALLRETVRKPKSHVRWIDGQQNLANVLTKAGADKSIFHQFLRDGLLSLVQTEENRLLKEKKRVERQNRKKVVQATGAFEAVKAARRKQAVAEAEQVLGSSAEEAG